MHNNYNVWPLKNTRASLNMDSVTISDFIVFIVIIIICAIMLNIAMTYLETTIAKANAARCIYKIYILDNNTIVIDKLCT